MNLPEIRPRQPLIGLAAAAMIGVAAADHWTLPALPLLIGSVVIGGVTLMHRRTFWCWVFAALAFAALHAFRSGEHPARALAAAIAEGPRVVEATGIVWSEPEPITYWAGQQSGRFQMKLEQLEREGHRVSVEHLVNVTWCGPLPQYGDRVTLLGSARNIEPVRNPGQFDARRYLQRQGIHSTIDARFTSDCRTESSGHGNAAMALALHCRRWLQTQLAHDLDDAPELRSLIASMVLGLRASAAPEEMQELFRRTGTLHLFAVSGLNTAMLAFIAWFVLKAFGVPRRAAVFAIIPILAGYALITGLSPSCVRAAIMGSLLLLAQLFERRGLVYNSLAAAALLILAWDTNQLFSTGFQFSFVLVATIVWLSTRIQRKLEPLAAPDPFLPRPLWSWRQSATALGGRIFAASFGVTFAAWIGSLLFTAGYFHLFSPSAIVANMFAVPLAFCILALGLCTALTAIFSTAAAVLFNNANWACAKLLLIIVEYFALLPGGHFFVELPKRGNTPICEFTVLDLGSGGGIHLRALEHDWLIDGGHRTRYANVTLPYLRSRGVNRLDAFLLTHGDAQHIGCAPAVIEDFRPRAIFDTPLKDRSAARRAFHQELAQRSRGKTFSARGDVLQIGGKATMRVLFPPAGLKRNAADDKALVLLLESAGVRALFMSDSGFPTEQWLLANEPDLRADLLIKGQHAKDLSGTPDFLRRVAPQVIIASAGNFGEPRANLDRWSAAARAQGAAVFRQDQCGAVTVRLHQGEYTATGFANQQIFRSRAR